MISIDITERNLTYTQAEYDQWFTREDPQHWKNMLPESERKRTKYPNQPRYHFSEVLHMRRLEAEGLKWFYEAYCIFRTPGRHSEVFKVGHEAIVEAFGRERVEEIQRLAGLYASPGKSPKDPDLFAYKGDAPNRVGVRFIELKREDRLDEMQLLGLALIQHVFEVPVEIVRYQPSGAGIRHQKDFAPLTDTPSRLPDPPQDRPPAL